MLNFFSSMLCASRIHPFSLGNYLRTSLNTIGNLMIMRVPSTCRMDLVRVPKIER